MQDIASDFTVTVTFVHTSNYPNQGTKPGSEQGGRKPAKSPQRAREQAGSQHGAKEDQVAWVPVRGTQEARGGLEP